MSLLSPFSSPQPNRCFRMSLQQRLRSFAILEDVGEQALRRLPRGGRLVRHPGRAHSLPAPVKNDRAVFFGGHRFRSASFVDEEEGPRRLVATISGR